MCNAPLLFKDGPYSPFDMPMTPRQLRIAREGKSEITLLPGVKLEQIEERYTIDQLILGNHKVLEGKDPVEANRLMLLAKNDKLNFLSTPENTKALIDPSNVQGERSIDVLNFIRLLRAAEKGEMPPEPLKSPTDAPVRERPNEIVKLCVKIMKDAPESDDALHLKGLLHKKNISVQDFAKMKDVDIVDIFIPETLQARAAKQKVQMPVIEKNFPVHEDHSPSRTAQIKHDLQIETFYTEENRRRIADLLKVYNDAGLKFPMDLDFDKGLDTDLSIFGIPTRPLPGFREFCNAMPSEMSDFRESLKHKMTDYLDFSVADPKAVAPMDRKIRVDVKIEDLIENDDVKQCFIEIAGDKFNKNKKSVSFVCNDFPTRFENESEALRMMRNTLIQARKMAKQFPNGATEAVQQ